MLVDGVLAVTPHWAGAVDIMAVRQMDGSIQSSPFYVRFGKYQSWRWNRQVCTFLWYQIPLICKFWLAPIPDVYTSLLKASFVKL